LIGAAVVGLGLIVLIVAVFALREPNGHVSAAAQTEQNTDASNVARDSRSGTPSRPPSRTPSSPTAPTSASHSADTAHDVPLVVLNNTTISGLAARAAERFQAGGWTVTSFGDYQNDIASSCAYYDTSTPGAQAAAEALQRQYPTIKRVEPKFAPEPGAEPLPSGPVVVVLTPDYSPA
jgi:hypothetical protein